MDAVTSLERLLASQEITFGKHNAELVRTLVKLGQASVDVGELSKAESSLLRAMDILSKVHGEKHIDVTFCLEQLAAIAKVQGNQTKADSLSKQAAFIKSNLPQAKPGTPALGSALQPLKFPTPPSNVQQPAKSVTAPPANAAKPQTPAPQSKPAQNTPSDSMKAVSQPPPMRPAPNPMAQTMVMPSSSSSNSGTSSNQPATCHHGLVIVTCEICVALQMASGRHGLSQTMSGNAMSTSGLIQAVVVKSTGLRIVLDEGVVWIGKDPMNDIALTNDPLVAGSHAVIENVKDQFWIRQCSGNPTTLNGREVTGKAILYPGDKLIIGGSELKME